MPGSLDVARDTGSLFHSFDLGAAHIVGINSEAWYRGVGLEHMMSWLRSDLEAAAAPGEPAREAVSEAVNEPVRQPASSQRTSE